MNVQWSHALHCMLFLDGDGLKGLAVKQVSGLCEPEIVLMIKVWCVRYDAGSHICPGALLTVKLPVTFAFLPSTSEQEVEAQCRIQARERHKQHVGGELVQRIKCLKILRKRTELRQCLICNSWNHLVHAGEWR